MDWSRRKQTQDMPSAKVRLAEKVAKSSTERRTMKGNGGCGSSSVSVSIRSWQEERMGRSTSVGEERNLPYREMKENANKRVDAMSRILASNLLEKLKVHLILLVCAKFMVV